MDKKNTGISNSKYITNTKRRTLLLFLQTADAYNRYSEIRLQKVGISIIRNVVLSALVINGGRMTPSEIAAWTFRSPHNITTLIRRMEKDELVSVTRSQTDNRSVDVTLTEKGNQLLNQAKPIDRDIRKRALASITDEQVKDLERVLKIIKSNMDLNLEIG